MQPRDLASLTDMLEAARLALSFIKDIDKNAFDNNLMVQSAVIRQIEIMGEAAKRLSAGFRESTPHIPWRNIAGMRDLLIHAYDHVDIDEVWNALSISIPELLRQIEPFVQKEQE